MNAHSVARYHLLLSIMAQITMNMSVKNLNVMGIRQWGDTMRFRITYTDDDGSENIVYRCFYDTYETSASEWAEDYAYNLADKRPINVESLDD